MSALIFIFIGFIEVTLVSKIIYRFKVYNFVIICILHCGFTNSSHLLSSSFTLFCFPIQRRNLARVLFKGELTLFILTNRVGMYPLPISLLAVSDSSVKFCYPDGYKMNFHCYFNLHLSVYHTLLLQKGRYKGTIRKEEFSRQQICSSG